MLKDNFLIKHNMIIMKDKISMYYILNYIQFEPQKANDFRRMNSSKIRFGLA